MVVVENNANANNGIRDIREEVAVENDDNEIDYIDDRLDEPVAQMLLGAIKSILDSAKKFTDLSDEEISANFTLPTFKYAAGIQNKMSKKILDNDQNYGVEISFLWRLFYYALISCIFSGVAYMKGFTFAMTIVTSLPVTLILFSFLCIATANKFSSQSDKEKSLVLVRALCTTGIMICDVFYFWFTIFEFLLMQWIVLWRKLKPVLVILGENLYNLALATQRLYTETFCPVIPV